jgi:hypothetical protein
VVTPRHWVEQRVGSRGKARANILRCLLENVALASECDLGLPLRVLCSISREFEFDTLSRLVPSRGNRDRLLEIAWFGSAVADVAASSEDPFGEQVLRDGALFNVAISLVDSVLDDASDPRSRALTHFLAPMHLRRRLIGEPIASSDDVRPIVRLFDDALGSIGQRWRHRVAVIDDADFLLSRMYKSEMVPTASRLDAKRLPFAFVGLVSDGTQRLEVLEVSERLGAFVALLDDWQDLGDDLIAGRANVFLDDRDLSLATLRPRIAGSARRRSLAEVATRLRTALDDTLVAADRAGSRVALKTRSFLGQLLCP